MAKHGKKEDAEAGDVAEDLGVDISEADAEGNPLPSGEGDMPDFAKDEAPAEDAVLKFNTSSPPTPGEFTGELNGDAYVAHFNDHLTAVVERYQAAHSDGKLSIGEVFGVVGELCGAAFFVFKALYGTGTSDEANTRFNEVAAAAEAAFDANIVPIDFPGVGPVIEGYLEKQARGMIRPALEYVRDIARMGK